MVAVSDTSPISNLALIDRLHLLRIQFDQVWIPDAVKSELDQIPNKAAGALIEQAVQDGWLGYRSVGEMQLVEALENELDRGEAALRAAWPATSRIEADVVPGNLASLRMFRNAGYDGGAPRLTKQLDECGARIILLVAHPFE